VVTKIIFQHGRLATWIIHKYKIWQPFHQMCMWISKHFKHYIQNVVTKLFFNAKIEGLGKDGTPIHLDIDLTHSNPNQIYTSNIYWNLPCIPMLIQANNQKLQQVLFFDINTTRCILIWNTNLKRYIKKTNRIETKNQ